MQTLAVVADAICSLTPTGHLEAGVCDGVAVLVGVCEGVGVLVPVVVGVLEGVMVEDAVAPVERDGEPVGVDVRVAVFEAVADVVGVTDGVGRYVTTGYVWMAFALSVWLPIIVPKELKYCREHEAVRLGWLQRL
jgi:hypothetical protein